MFLQICFSLADVCRFALFTFVVIGGTILLKWGETMLEVAQLTIGKVAMLLCFIVAGFLLRASGELPESAAKNLSVLSATIFCPAYNLRNLWNNFTVAKISENALVMSYGLLITLAAIALAWLFASFFEKPGFARRSLAYAFSIPNYGYFGYPVIEGVFGSQVLTQVLVFVVPLSIATNTYGYLLFTPNGKITWKRLLNPLILAVVIGMALGLLGIPMPGFIEDVLVGAGNCMSPVAMLLAGFVLGAFPLKKLLAGWRGYWVSAIRLLAIPALFLGALLLCGAKGIWLLLPMVVVAMPLGLNLVVYPESMGMDASDNARMCCVSYLMAIVVLPVVFALLARLA